VYSIHACLAHLKKKKTQDPKSTLTFLCALLVTHSNMDTKASHTGVRQESRHIGTRKIFTCHSYTHTHSFITVARNFQVVIPSNSSSLETSLEQSMKQQQTAQSFTDLPW